MDYLNPLAFGRLSPEHEIVPLAGGQAYDDVLKCNTQVRLLLDGPLAHALKAYMQYLCPSTGQHSMGRLPRMLASQAPCLDRPG